MIKIGDRVCVVRPMPKQWDWSGPRTGIVLQMITTNSDPRFWSYWIGNRGRKESSGYDEVTELISRKQRARTW